MRKVLLPKRLLVENLTASLLKAREEIYNSTDGDRLSFVNACQKHDELLTLFILVVATPDEVYDQVMLAAGVALADQVNVIANPPIV